MRSLSRDLKGQRPVLIQPSRAESYLEKVSSVDFPIQAKMSDMTEMLAALFGNKPILEKFPPYAIVPIKGVIGKDLAEIEKYCGCCDVHDVEEMLEECERDTQIECVILMVDSPGGCSTGVPELANMVKFFPKKVISFTSGECCSAAYWVASQASEFYATPSSTVGSIGVYIAYPDCSKAYDMEGVKIDVIKSGAYKGAGIPGTSLDQNQRKMLQQEVDDLHADFKNAVKMVRSFVEDSSMEGQCFSGKRGAEAGLVTSLTNGFDALMESLDADIQKQIEADEQNDERHEESEGEDMEQTCPKPAYARALDGIKMETPSESKKHKKFKENRDEEDEDEDENGEEKDVKCEPTKDDGEEAQPKAEEDGEEAVDTDSDTDEKSKKKTK